MCLFCDNVKKLVNANVIIYDGTTTNVIKDYSYLDSTVTLKIAASGLGMLELKGLKYCPNCGEKIEDFDNCASKENDKISCEIEKLKRDVEDLKKGHNDIVNLYERLAKGGIECSMTVDDKNGICSIYSPGIELADDSERINKSFEDVLEEEEE